MGSQSQVTIVLHNVGKSDHPYVDLVHCMWAAHKRMHVYAYTCKCKLMLKAVVPVGLQRG